MIFALLTLLSALSLAGVAGWFSIIGITAIYAAAPAHAIIMGVVLEAGKLVTTSWLYRNWAFSDWKIKIPLIIFTVILMLATSIGVFGFLSKAHLEQGAGTVDNSAKTERLAQQISREKATIDDDQKIIGQLDATINSYLGKDRTDKSLAVRKSQTPQRNQLRADIDAAQKRIDGYSDEKLKLDSEVRKLQLDVGPIRYIAELFYGTDGSAEKNIEAAVRMFTLLIVSTLDPLAVILLIAANHTILRQQNAKKEIIQETTQDLSTREPDSDKEASDIVYEDTSLPEAQEYPIFTKLYPSNYREDGGSEVVTPVLSEMPEAVTVNEETNHSEELVLRDVPESQPVRMVGENSGGNIPPVYIPERVSVEMGDDITTNEDETGQENATTTEVQDEISINEEETPLPIISEDAIVPNDSIREDTMEAPINVTMVAESRWAGAPSIRFTWPSIPTEIQSETVELPIIRNPEPTLVAADPLPGKSDAFHELFGYTAGPHFIPQRLHEKEKHQTSNEVGVSGKVSPQGQADEKNPPPSRTVVEEEAEIFYQAEPSAAELEETGSNELEDSDQLATSATSTKESVSTQTSNTPKTLSWLSVFKKD